MSCCKSSKGPRLGYSVVSESAGCFGSPADTVNTVSKAGFCTLTIVSEHAVWVHVGTPATKEVTVNGQKFSAKNITAIDIPKEGDAIRDKFTPPAKQKRNAAGQPVGPSGAKELIKAAIAKGMCVQIVPHLDAIGSAPANKEWNYAPLSAMPWRANFWFDPMGAAYKDHVILPLLRAAIEGIKEASVSGDANCKPCVSFVLGSEVELSVAGNGGRWSSLLAAMRAFRDGAGGLPPEDRKRIEFGHKINHDFASSLDYWVEIWASSHAGANPDRASAKSLALKYLSELDFISFSFYPNLGKANEWDKKLRPQQVKTLAEKMNTSFEKMKKDLKDSLPAPPAGRKAPCMEIGEAGIGWIDPSMPQKDVPTRQGFPDCKAADLKRYWRIKFNYFAALLMFLESQPAAFAADKCGSDCLTDYRPVSLWTNHWQFDLLGLNLRKFTDDEGRYAKSKGRIIKKKFIDGKLNKGVLDLIKRYGAGLFSEGPSKLEEGIGKYRTALRFESPGAFFASLAALFIAFLENIWAWLLGVFQTSRGEEEGGAPSAFPRQAFMQEDSSLEVELS